MQLLNLSTKPSLVLRSLLAARTLIAEHNQEFTAPIDELIARVTQYIDEEPRREGAVKDARRVAEILIREGGVAAREGLVVPPPNPIRQQNFFKSSRGYLDDSEAADIASKMHAVEIEVDDDAACCVAGAKYSVTATIYLPIDLDEADEQSSSEWPSATSKRATDRGPWG